jgi:hypothetical protein
MLLYSSKSLTAALFFCIQCVMSHLAGSLSSNSLQTPTQPALAAGWQQRTYCRIGLSGLQEKVIESQEPLQLKGKAKTWTAIQGGCWWVQRMDEKDRAGMSTTSSCCWQKACNGVLHMHGILMCWRTYSVRVVDKQPIG